MVIRDFEKSDAEARRVITHEAVSAMFLNLKEKHCTMCTGFGHAAKDCATLKTMNRTTRNIPGMKAAWGTIKAQYVQAAVFKAVAKGQIGRSRLKRLHNQRLDEDETAFTNY